jgi:hypothetical protein
MNVKIQTLQIYQGWIQMKSVHPLYQLQVVFNDDDVRVAPTKPYIWIKGSSIHWLWSNLDQNPSLKPYKYPLKNQGKKEEE